MIAIKKMHVRFRMPDARNSHRRRLDNATDLLLRGALERAVESVGVHPREEICIRRISRTVRLRLSGTDEAMAEDWGRMLADEIRRVSAGTTMSATGGVGADVIRFPSRTHALLDVVAGVTRGDFCRAWAWRQLGLWPTEGSASTTEAMEFLVGALGRNSESIVPVLAGLASNGTLASLVHRLESRHWLTLAGAAIRDGGGHWLRDLLARGCLVDDALRSASNFVPEQSAGVTASRRLFARRIVASSSIAQLFQRSPMPGPGRLAALTLVLLEAAPAFLSKPRADVLSQFVALESEIWTGPPLPRAAGQNPKHEPQPQSGKRIETDHSRLAQDPEPDMGIPEEPLAASTRYGGLLFLLSLIEPLRIPIRILEKFPDRPFRWVMHALATGLVKAPSYDPAVLAFAGLPPDAMLPDQDADPITPEERETLVLLAQEMGTELQRRISQLGLGVNESIDFVCARAAKILAGPGWIEAHFALEGVSTDLRRAALDLDPGYVSSLGVIMTFVYE